ncbi:hypothetical protein EG327_001169 [Venturia inaequalis]|uniref:Mannan endo-1,6-alpha-mannosidase n=1 Tax=Venturia inaequalis TaxID=5025 RepID=A0A8H3VPH4_VENIN|nr:hypothetical protein EG327_001169 [Venturia inaequalis]
MFPPPLSKVLLAILAIPSCVIQAIQLDVKDPASLRAAASTISKTLLTYYKNDAPNTPPEKIGLLPFPPYYWWESGAMWAGIIDYTTYTKDTSHVNKTIQALLAQRGPKNDYIVPAHRGDEGNDDQTMWGLGLMSAVENNFPGPPEDQPQWFPMVIALFKDQASRWDMESCGGGLKWQMYPGKYQNAYGYNYKNSISNGAFFQLAARLALYTGEQYYIDWAEKVWDWSWRTGLISPTYDVFDGTDDKKNCTSLDHTQWSYNVAVYIEGTAAMWNTTQKSIWGERTVGLLGASEVFFSPFPNATGIMFEAACEPANKCNNDQVSFKAYLGRWLAKTMILAPFTAKTIRPLLETSAMAAAKSCSGGSDGVACGTKWWVGGYDGKTGVGQQLSALEVIQSLLIEDADRWQLPRDN